MPPYTKRQNSLNCTTDGVHKIIKILSKRPRLRSKSGYEVEKLYEANFLRTKRTAADPPEYRFLEKHAYT